MFRRQTTQDALAFMFMEDVIDEVEFLMLFEMVNKKNPSFPFWSYDRFDLTSITEEECKAKFRFGLAELPLLLPFSSYRERPTFFRVVTRSKHSSLSRQTVAFFN